MKCQHFFKSALYTKLKMYKVPANCIYIEVYIQWERKNLAKRRKTYQTKRKKNSHNEKILCKKDIIKTV